MRQCMEQAITAIASVADCAEDYFNPYFASVMPLLKQILVLAMPHDLHAGTRIYH